MTNTFAIATAACELAEIRAIWEEKFPAEEEYQQIMFSKIIPHCSNYITKNEDGKIVSVISLTPMKLINEDKGAILNGWYMFGVGTKSGFEGKGYSTSLISHVISELQINNFDFIFERPANQELINFYLKFGFTEFVKKQKHMFTDKIYSKPAAETLLNNIRESFRIRFEWPNIQQLEALIELGEIERHNELQNDESLSEKCYIAIKPLKNLDTSLFQNAFFCFPRE